MRLVSSSGGWCLFVGRLRVRWVERDFQPLFSERYGLRHWHTLGRLGWRVDAPETPEQRRIARLEADGWSWPPNTCTTRHCIARRGHPWGHVIADTRSDGTHWEDDRS